MQRSRPINARVTFQAREFKGSRLRCLVATSLPNRSVAQFLNTLVTPYAQVAASDVWQPRGFLEPEEACIGKDVEFLSPDRRELVTAAGGSAFGSEPRNSLFDAESD
jgi:hypothetical protein